jgi:hypothetical protein
MYEKRKKRKREKKRKKREKKRKKEKKREIKRKKENKIKGNENEEKRERGKEGKRKRGKEEKRKLPITPSASIRAMASSGKSMCFRFVAGFFGDVDVFCFGGGLLEFCGVAKLCLLPLLLL